MESNCGEHCYWKVIKQLIWFPILIFSRVAVVTPHFISMPQWRMQDLLEEGANFKVGGSTFYLGQFSQKKPGWKWNRFISLTLVYPSTNVLTFVWTKGFWRTLVHIKLVLHKHVTNFEIYLSAQGECLPDTLLWTESQTDVKSLPCCNYVTNGKKLLQREMMKGRV